VSPFSTLITLAPITSSPIRSPALTTTPGPCRSTSSAASWTAP